MERMNEQIGMTGQSKNERDRMEKRGTDITCSAYDKHIGQTKKPLPFSASCMAHCNNTQCFVLLSKDIKLAAEKHS